MVAVLVSLVAGAPPAGAVDRSSLPIVTATAAPGELIVTWTPSV